MKKACVMVTGAPWFVQWHRDEEMKALHRNRILLSGRGLYFGTCKLDLLAGKNGRCRNLNNYGMDSASEMYFLVVLLPPMFSSS